MYRVMCMTYTVRFVTNSVDKNDHLWQRQLEYQLYYPGEYSFAEAGGG